MRMGKFFSILFATVLSFAISGNETFAASGYIIVKIYSTEYKTVTYDRGDKTKPVIETIKGENIQIIEKTISDEWYEGVKIIRKSIKEIITTIITLVHATTTTTTTSTTATSTN